MNIAVLINLPDEIADKYRELNKDKKLSSLIEELILDHEKSLKKSRYVEDSVEKTDIDSEGSGLESGTGNLSKEFIARLENLENEVCSLRAKLTSLEKGGLIVSKESSSLEEDKTGEDEGIPKWEELSDEASDLLEDLLDM